MDKTEYKVLSDGRRLDVLLSEAAGLSRSRAAALMEEGLCVSEGKEIRILGRRWYAQGGEWDGCMFSVCSDSPVGSVRRIVF